MNVKIGAGRGELWQTSQVVSRFVDWKPLRFKNMVEVEPYSVGDTSHSKITGKKINIYAIKTSS